MQTSNENKPLALTTMRYKITAAVFAGIVGGIIAILVLFGLSPNAGASVDGEYSPNDFMLEPVVTNVQEEVDATNTPENACSFLKTYYRSLANKDSEPLRKLGCIAAADALDRNWLRDIGYAVDIDKLSEPYIAVFPEPQGIYAGCTLYKISDFYAQKPQDAVYNEIIGMHGAEGWIYYDSMDMKWKIVDPTMPTAISAAEAKNVTRKSNDTTVVVKMSTPGAYSNPWWSYTQISVEINNKSKSDKVTTSVSKFDDGLKAQVPEELLQPIEPLNIKNGICQVFRGVKGDFGIDRIGAGALMIDGDVCPVRISYKEEDISPIVAIGNITTEEIQALLTQAQIEQFNATNMGFNYVTSRISNDSRTTSSSSSSDSTNTNNENASSAPISIDTNVGVNSTRGGEFD